jgi:hypothetical protein
MHQHDCSAGSTVGGPPDGEHVDPTNGDDACPDDLSLADLRLAFGDLNRRISEHLDWLRRYGANGTPRRPDAGEERRDQAVGMAFAPDGDPGFAAGEQAGLRGQRPC